MDKIQVPPEKTILDVTCSSRSIWFDKHHPNAIYCDVRKAHYEHRYGKDNTVRTVDIDPDVICDFRDLPFESNTFQLVVFDPPHIMHKPNDEELWLVKAYGSLEDNWREVLHDGFVECMRVLKPNGVLVFKWSETSIPAPEVWKALGEKPLFGHRSGIKSGTFWGCFMKMESDQISLDDIQKIAENAEGL